MDKRKLTGNLVLLLTALIWGSAFVAQRVGMDYVGPFTFGFSRFIFAALILIPVMYFMDQSKRKQLEQNKENSDLLELTLEEKIQQKKMFLIGGISCGTILFCGSTLQQFGLMFTTAGKAGFITALYIVLVPIFSLFLKHRPGVKSWIGVCFGAMGLYLLCITESFTIQQGDFIVLIGAGFWAAHLLVIDHFLPRISDPIKLSFLQFCICALYSGIAALIFEEIHLTDLLQCAIPILYAGLLSGGVGFTLQIVGQKYTTPTVASLLLSMEAVFAAIFGFLLLGEKMNTRELMGCLLMFVAIIISQLPDKNKIETI